MASFTASVRILKYVALPLTVAIPLTVAFPLAVALLSPLMGAAVCPSWVTSWPFLLLHSKAQ